MEIYKVLIYDQMNGSELHVKEGDGVHVTLVDGRAYEGVFLKPSKKEFRLVKEDGETLVISLGELVPDGIEITASK